MPKWSAIVAAIALGVTALVVALSGSGHTTVVVRAARQSAPTVVYVQSPSTPGPVLNPRYDPYDMPQYGDSVQQYGYPAATVQACDMINRVVTDAGVVSVIPEKGAGRDYCVFDSQGSAYSVVLNIEPYATAADFYSSMAAESPTKGMTVGPISRASFDESAPNVRLAYEFSGTFSEGGTYETAVVLVAGPDGEFYLVRVSVDNNFGEMSPGSAFIAAADVANSIGASGK